MALSLIRSDDLSFYARSRAMFQHGGSLFICCLTTFFISKFAVLAGFHFVLYAVKRGGAVSFCCLDTSRPRGAWHVVSFAEC